MQYIGERWFLLLYLVNVGNGIHDDNPTYVIQWNKDVFIYFDLVASQTEHSPESSVCKMPKADAFCYTVCLTLTSLECNPWFMCWCIYEMKMDLIFDVILKILYKLIWNIVRLSCIFTLTRNSSNLLIDILEFTVSCCGILSMDLLGKVFFYFRTLMMHI